MEKIKRALAEWRRLPTTMIPLERIETDEGLQPRTLDAVPAKYRHRLTELSETHVERMRAELLGSADKESDAVLLAECNGCLLLVDGHHRLEAYRKAGRGSIPARVLAISLPQAVMVSKLVNCDGVKLPLHPEQAREAAWQYLAHATTQGKRPLPAGLSTRGVGAAFGVSKSTILRMTTALPKVNLDHFDAVACDPGTDWPRWRHVRGNAWRDSASEVPLQDRQRAQAERLAEKLAKLRDSSGPEVFRMAVDLLIAEHRDAADDLLDELADMDDLDREAGVTSDY